MNGIPWYRVIMLVLVIFSLAGLYICSAEDIALPQTSGISSPPTAGETESPSPKATIAPIHTKEPEVKPPVNQPGTTPIQTVAVQTKTTVTKSPTPTAQLTPEVTISPGNNETAETYYQWGRAFEDVGSCEAAISEYDRAIARDPYFADAWYHRALCYENLGLSDEAYESYRFLLSVNPGYHSGANNSTLSSIRENISLDGGEDDGSSTPLVWVIAGAGLSAIIIGGFLIWHYIRRERSAYSVSGVSRQTPVNSSHPGIIEVARIVSSHYSGDIEIFKSLLEIAIEISREGREGKKVGTAFILGDSEAVLEKSRQLILNPLHGHSDAERLITNPDMRENIKELALVDGAFVIREDGVVVAAGRYVSIDTSSVSLAKGFGTRHVSIAAITQETNSIGIVVSESGGTVRILAGGKMIAETG